MKTKKLWIWSFIFGLLATVGLYLIINSNNDQRIAKAETTVTKSAEKKENVDTAADAKTPQQNTTEASKEAEKGNKLLPISPGKRAMSIQVTEAQGISGFIKQGTFVDVMAKIPVPTGVKPGQHDASKFIIQNAKVLAVGHAADDEEKMKRYQLITLEVNPKDGLALGLATKYELYLLLREEGDNKVDTNTHFLEDQLHEGVFVK